MSERRHVAVGLTVGLLVLFALAPTLTSARPAHEIPVEQVGGSLTTPDATGWNGVPRATVALASAPSGLPDADQTSTERVHVRAATNESHLFMRVTWPDATNDSSATDPRSFADALAVQVPVNTSSRPAIAMGSSRNLVNVWYWNADAGTEELLAGGAGTTTAFSDRSVATTATHSGDGANATWSVVYTRPLEPAGENRTQISAERDLDVAFAVWNGSNGERSGRKAVSDWYYLATGPGPQGPPYEAILWTVAGIAVVATLAVTAYGVRRTDTAGEGVFD